MRRLLQQSKRLLYVAFSLYSSMELRVYGASLRPSDATRLQKVSSSRLNDSNDFSRRLKTLPICTSVDMAHLMCAHVSVRLCGRTRGKSTGSTLPPFFRSSEVLPSILQTFAVRGYCMILLHRLDRRVVSTVCVRQKEAYILVIVYCIVPVRQ